MSLVTYLDRVTHICFVNLTIIGSDNGFSPDRRQAIIWTSAGISLIRTLGTNLSEILSEIRMFSFTKTHLKMSSGKWRPFCLGLNVLTHTQWYDVPWWRHQMEAFSALLAICAGNSPVTGEFHAQRPVTRSFDVFFDLLLNKRWVNTREAGDLRRYRAHYDVTVMLW